MSLAVATQPSANEQASAPQQLHCMEIWGGNELQQRALTVPGVDAWVHCEPFGGHASGGDVHYVSMCGAGNISRFAVADVAGHGADVGALAQCLRKLMRKHINMPDQTRFAQALNEEFSQFSQTGRFATAVLATYFAPTNHLIVCNAGHPRPLWYRAETAQWQLLRHDLPQCADKVHNLPLGVIKPTDYVQFAVKLERGDVVVMYTDSLIEASGADGRQLGEQGLLDLARQAKGDDPQQFSDHLLQSVSEFRSRAPAQDDQTILALYHNAEDPPDYPLGERIKTVARMLGLMKV